MDFSKAPELPPVWLFAAAAPPGSNADHWVTNAQGKFIFDFATIGLGA